MKTNRLFINVPIIFLTTVLSFQPFLFGTSSNSGSSDNSLQIYYTALENLQSGDTASAINSFRALVERPNQDRFSLKSHWELGWWFFFQANFESAAVHFNTLETIPTETAWSRSGQLGQAILDMSKKNQDKREDAFHMFSSMIRQNYSSKTNGLGLLGSGMFEFSQGRYELAREHVSRIIVDGNTDRILLMAHHLAALIELHSGNPFGALNNYQKSLFYAHRSFPFLEKRYVNASKWVFSVLIATGEPLQSKKMFDLSRKQIQKVQDHKFGRDNLLTVLDHTGWLVTFDRDTQDTVAQFRQSDTHRLASGGGGGVLFVGSDAIFDDSVKVPVRSTERRRIVDAVWGTPGEYWLLDSRNNVILRIASDGGIGSRNQAFRIHRHDRIVSDPFGGVWYLNWRDKNVVYFNAHGVRQHTFTFDFENNKIQSMNDFVVSPMGLLYFLDGQSKTITITNRSGNHLRTIALDTMSPSIEQPVSMDFDQDFQLLVSDQLTNALYEIY
jgi:tetratricopeptide (TPR) repeat protein